MSRARSAVVNRYAVEALTGRSQSHSLQWVQDVARIDVILDRQLRHVVGGIVPPRRQQPVPVLVDDERGEVVVLAAVFQAVLIVREDVDEIVAAVIAPGCGPLARTAGVVVGVLATATIAAFEIAGRVDDETGVALAVTDGLGRHADHFADRRHAGRREFDVGQVHLRDQPLRVDQGEPPFRIVGRGEVGPRRPLRRGAAAAAGNMAVAADDALDLIRRHTCLVHRLLAGQDRVGAHASGPSRLRPSDGRPANVRHPPPRPCRGAPIRRARPCLAATDTRLARHGSTFSSMLCGASARTPSPLMGEGRVGVMPPTR